ncbi:hypothetical protein L9F63_002245 [Diploptera punctata]|uniref:Uncharacterized protein n=1 Tax=Diploptera punctata TaxID=6984 RepID=A0AAD8EIJ7_DIPPU|nr:hypothetical protein L9F63_002245 [Diploptera punctata]
MGKTPKDKHGVERRRPYNYPRNAQARTQNSGTESRNYGYSTGNVQRKIPIYHGVPFAGVRGPLPNQAYHFGRGRGFRGRIGGNKPLKPIHNRQRRPDLRNKRFVSPQHKSSVRRNMQAETEEQDNVQENIQQTSEQLTKNGPESDAVSTEDENLEETEKVENRDEVTNSVENCDSNGITNDVEDDVKSETKSKSTSNKEKKTKKASPTVKTPSKSKHSPKSKKESKPETDEEPEASENEKEKTDLKNVESESKKQESSDFQPSVKIRRLTAPTDSSDTNDSIVEIPIDKENKSQEVSPSTSTADEVPKTIDVHVIRDSPRRSTRLSKIDSSSIIILDSDDSISVLELSRKSQEKSFAQSIRSVSGRRSLRPLPSYNRSFNRSPYTPGSASVRTNVSNRSVTTSNDSESDTQDAKLTQSRSSIWGIFRSSSTNPPSQDSVTDNEESTNRSCADDSGNDSEATTEPIFSSQKRKIEDAEIAEPEHESKKIRSSSENNSSGLLSIVSSPMTLFTSKLRGDKSSTPLQVLKTSDTDDGDAEIDISMHHQEANEIEYEENISKTLNEKEDMENRPDNLQVEQEGNARRWCTIM